jgi:hypothetical protein
MKYRVVLLFVFLTCVVSAQEKVGIEDHLGPVYHAAKKIEAALATSTLFPRYLELVANLELEIGTASDRAIPTESELLKQYQLGWQVSKRVIHVWGGVVDESPAVRTLNGGKIRGYMILSTLQFAVADAQYQGDLEKVITAKAKVREYIAKHKSWEDKKLYADLLEANK